MHEEHPWAEQVAAYVLDALDEDERRAFVAHLVDCPRCQAEVAQWAPVVAALAEAVPRRSPPARLRRRVLALARAAPSAAGRRRGGLWGLLALAACLVVVVVLGWAYATTRARLQALDRELERWRRQAAEQRALLAAALDPATRRAPLSGPARGQALYHPAQGVVIVALEGLAPPPARRTYQLWGLPAHGAPISLGTFVPDAAGRARLVVRVPPDTPLVASAVTEEPAGGSPQPTQAPFLVARWGG